MKRLRYMVAAFAVAISFGGMRVLAQQLGWFAYQTYDTSILSRFPITEFFDSPIFLHGSTGSNCRV